MGFYEKTADAIQKAHSELAHEFIVHNYQWDGTISSNEYSDGQWRESTETVDATIRSDNGDSQSGPEGEDVVSAPEIYVPSDAVAVRIGQDDETRATEFVDTRTGRRYKASGTKHEGAIIRVRCEAV